VVAQRDALAAENASLKQAADFATTDDMWIEQHDGMLDYRYKDWYVDVLKNAMQTPATDAYLNSVRADTLTRIINTGQFSNWVNQGLQEWVNRFNANSDAQLRSGKDGEQ